MITNVAENGVARPNDRIFIGKWVAELKYNSSMVETAHSQ